MIFVMLTPDDYPFDPEDPEATREAMQKVSNDIAEALGGDPLQIPELGPEQMEALKRLREQAASRYRGEAAKAMLDQDVEARAIESGEDPARGNGGGEGSSRDD